MMHIGNEWDALLADEIQKDYYLKLRQFLISEYTTRRIYPPMEDIFNALRHTSYSDVRAVILGQDPYHGPGQAHGMCFSVKRGSRHPSHPYFSCAAHKKQPPEEPGSAYNAGAYHWL